MLPLFLALPATAAPQQTPKLEIQEGRALLVCEQIGVGQCRVDGASASRTQSTISEISPQSWAQRQGYTKIVRQSVYFDTGKIYILMEVEK